jgi:hypothetical protein
MSVAYRLDPDLSTKEYVEAASLNLGVARKMAARLYSGVAAWAQV